ncbi:MAG: hypothetical protein V3W04_14355 [Gammaproteobacteria bacterium]
MSSDSPSPKIITGKQARKSAAMFNIGNIIAILLPIPLGMLWFGVSMLVYALNRHHPNEKVGEYTQQAAYRFYGITGFFVAAATFIPGSNWSWYLIAWLAAGLILIPWSVFDLIKISKDKWVDVPVQETQANF